MEQNILERIKKAFPNHEPQDIVEKLVSMYENASTLEKRYISKKLGIND